MSSQQIVGPGNVVSIYPAKRPTARVNADVDAYYYGDDPVEAEAFGTGSEPAVGYCYQNFDFIGAAYSLLRKRDVQAFQRQAKRGVPCKAAALFHFSDEWATELDELLCSGVFTQYKGSELVWIAYLQLMDARNELVSKAIAAEALRQNDRARAHGIDLTDQLMEPSGCSDSVWRQIWKEAEARVAYERLQKSVCLKSEPAVRKIKI